MTDSVSSRVRPAGRSRNGAVAAAAIPAVVLTALGSAAPAFAAEPAAAPSFLAPKAATGANIAAARDRIAAHLVASQVPSRVTVATAAATSVVVKPGDTLSAIANKHGVSVASIVKLNGLASANRIFVGERLTLRAGTSAKATSKSTAKATTTASAGAYTVVSGDTLSGIAAKRGMTLGALLGANGLKTTSIIYPGQKLKVTGSSTSSAKASTSTASTSASGTYTVVSGDTLSGIAAKRGMTLGALLGANGLKTTSIIFPGQKLKVTGSSSSSTATASSQLVPNTFLHYTYPAATVASANQNKAILLSRNLPSRAQMKAIIASTAAKMGVNPALALAHAYQESGFNMAAVSPANAIGAMQVIPSSGEWASQLVGRKLDLLNPYDNATAGIAIIRALQRTSATEEIGIASYYQGQASVRKYGMFNDTKRYVANVLAHKKTFS